MRISLSVALLMTCTLLLGAAHAACLADSSSDGFLLPPVMYPGYGMCAPGYYCPNTVASNMSTWPQYCPATPSCIALRLSNQLCPPQGTYEPAVCSAGSYCPNASVQLPCPAKHFCPPGTTKPYPCATVSHCPVGTKVTYNFGSVVLIVVVDLLVIGLHFGMRRVQAKSRDADALKFTALRNGESIHTPTADNKAEEMSPLSRQSCAAAAGGWEALTPEDRDIICQGIYARRGSMKKMDFVFSDLSVTIPAQTNDHEDKVLLRSVSGALRAGHVTAVMGPSGAGKTIFFTALLSKLESSWQTTGSLSINGQPRDAFERFRHVIGYVPQDDTLHTELSVEDNVWYASEVRLPREWSAARRAAYRQAAMAAVGVTSIVRTKASDLSSSQRKKCSIAVELASAPASLFLDEPTSSLDATAALEVCRTLTAVARASQITVVMVIHQPRVEIWNSLDHVLFLAPGGRTVYQGPREDAEKYFSERLGFSFGVGNPADVIMDGIAEKQEACVDEWTKYLSQTADTTLPLTTHQTLVGDDDAPEAYPPPDANASFLRQVLLVHDRSLLKQSTQLHHVAFHVVMGMLAAALMACAAIQTPYVGILKAPYSVISPRHKAYLLAMLAMFYHLAVAATSSVTALRCFMHERECYWREMATGGHNRVAYYLGAVLAETYRLVVTSLHFAVVAYFMLQPLEDFWEYWLFILLIFLGIDSQAAMLSIVLPPAAAPLLATVAGVFVSLLNGFPAIPFMMNVGFSYYLTEAFMCQELAFTNDLYSEPVLTQYHVNRKGVDYGAAVGIIALYRVIGFVLIKYTNRDKQR